MPLLSQHIRTDRGMRRRNASQGARKAPWDYPPPAPQYAVRFIPAEHAAKLVNLYHLARTALVGKECTPYTRMIWASSEYARGSNSVSATGAYKDLCGLLDR